MPVIGVRGGQEKAEIYLGLQKVDLTQICLTIILAFLVHF